MPNSWNVALRYSGGKNCISRSISIGNRHLSSITVGRTCSRIMRIVERQLVLLTRDCCERLRQSAEHSARTSIITDEIDVLLAAEVEGVGERAVVGGGRKIDVSLNDIPAGNCCAASGDIERGKIWAYLYGSFKVSIHKERGSSGILSDAKPGDQCKCL